MNQTSYIKPMENLKTTTQLAKETGLSKERINQYARKFGVQKLGAYYVWTPEQEQGLYSRMGARGQKLSYDKKNAINQEPLSLHQLIERVLEPAQE